MRVFRGRQLNPSRVAHFVHTEVSISAESLLKEISDWRADLCAPPSRTSSSMSALLRKATRKSKFTLISRKELRFFSCRELRSLISYLSQRGKGTWGKCRRSNNKIGKACLLPQGGGGGGGGSRDFK